MVLPPRKKFFRQRAHVNPFSETGMEFVVSPYTIDWGKYYGFSEPPKYLDLGCGYGKFLIEISKEGRSVGFEIRNKVASYTQQLIESKNYKNCCVIRTNGFFFIPNFFLPSSLEKIFVLFPDPHFKKKKEKARIISTPMLDIYEYVLSKSGRLYISTDVISLFEYMVEIINQHPSFESVENDPLEERIKYGTDESERAGKKTGAAYSKVFQVIK